MTKRSKKLNGRSCGSLGKQEHHRRWYLVKNGLACWWTAYKTLDEALKVLD